MKLLKFGWKTLFILFMIFSLTLNIAMFMGGAMYKLASSAFSAATGVRSVAAQHADEVADLGRNLASERKVSQKLRGEVIDISDNLVSERKVTKRLRGEVTELSGNLSAQRLALKKARSEAAGSASNVVTYKGKKVARKQAVEATANAISKRAAKTSARSVTSMAGEAIPYVGTAVIVGVTALELKDLCDTIKDMNELKRAFDPSLSPNQEEATVCSMKVPTTEELWDVAKASPGQAWAAAKDVTPSLQDLKNYEFPDIDWSGAWNSTAVGAGTAWSTTIDGAGVALDATKETTGNWINDAAKYWLEDDGAKNSE